MTQRILVISDNPVLSKGLVEMLPALGLKPELFSFNCSKGSEKSMTEALGMPIDPISVKQDWNSVVKSFDLVISLHCKQLFPAKMVDAVRCVNVHPGLNPYNRGWFPQVFAIMNGLPHGATIHEIDADLDHGPIIAQREVSINADDTSLSVYNKVQDIELKLLRENLVSIIDNSYTAFQPKSEGNLNMIKDYRALLELNPNEELTMLEAIDRLRALTHGEYQNAYFLDPINGEKIYVTINLQRESVND